MVQVVRVTWMFRVVLVIKFVNAYGLHGVNNQIIEKTRDVTPVTHRHTDTRTVENSAVFCLSRIRNLL